MSACTKLFKADTSSMKNKTNVIRGRKQSFNNINQYNYTYKSCVLQH